LVDSDCSSARKAAILIADIEAALARGTRHYDKKGRQLKTVAEVVKALLEDRGVLLGP